MMVPHCSPSRTCTPPTFLGRHIASECSFRSVSSPVRTLVSHLRRHLLHPGCCPGCLHPGRCPGCLGLHPLGPDLPHRLPLHRSREQSAELPLSRPRSRASTRKRRRPSQPRISTEGSTQLITEGLILYKTIIQQLCIQQRNSFEVHNTAITLMAIRN